MISVIQLLTAEEVERIRALVSDAPESSWQDGKETAGVLIQHRKSNQQMRQVPEEISQIFHVALSKNEALSSLTLPMMISKPMISRYRDADGYGWHVDNGLQGAGDRRDISVSLILSDPKSYEGGELVFNFGSLRSGLRPELGQAVLFPSQLEHCVRPVRGERIVLLAWITSRIPDPMHREIAYRLQRALELLPVVTKDVPLDSPEREEVISAVSFARNNLVRAWSSR